MPPRCLLVPVKRLFSALNPCLASPPAGAPARSRSCCAAFPSPFRANKMLFQLLWATCAADCSSSKWWGLVFSLDVLYPGFYFSLCILHIVSSILTSTEVCWSTGEQHLCVLTLVSLVWSTTILFIIAFAINVLHSPYSRELFFFLS